MNTKSSNSVQRQHHSTGMEGMDGAVRDLAALTTRLLLHLGSDKTNMAISPLSFHSVLVLLAAGATGDTFAQIVSFLGSSGDTAHASLASQVASGIFAGENSAGPEVRCAVGIWVDSSFQLRPEFAKKVAVQYKAGARAMPFQDKADEATVEINRWFEDKTGGFIRDLIPHGHLDSDTILVVGNALYLRGTWLDLFDRDDTMDGDFFLPDKSRRAAVRVPFMTSRNRQLISCHPGFKVLQLPYEGGGNRRFSMHIYLPNERDGLGALVRELSSDTAGFLDRGVPARPVEVGDFRIPKFKVSFKTEASKLLRDMRLERPFRPSYDFAEMVDCSEPLVVGSVLHECVVEVNEDGTMAAAATEADMIAGFSIEGEEHVEVVDFVADHPFLFLVREDKSGIVLFAGQVVNPLL